MIDVISKVLSEALRYRSTDLSLCRERIRIKEEELVRLRRDERELQDEIDRLENHMASTNTPPISAEQLSSLWQRTP